MFKTVVKIIARIKPTTTTKHQQVIIKHDIQFNIYSYESVDDKYKCIYIKK